MSLRISEGRLLSMTQHLNHLEYGSRELTQAREEIERLEVVAEAARYVLRKEGQPVSIIALDELSEALDALNKGRGRDDTSKGRGSG